MKKLLTLLVFLATTIGTMAQTSGLWKNIHNTQAQGRTVVYASLSVTNGDDVYNGNYTIAAFVGQKGQEECRLVCADNAAGVLEKFYPEQAQIDIPYLALQIPGNYNTNNEDDGLPITFMIKKSNGEIYQLTASETINYRQEGAYGEPVAPVELSVTFPTSYELQSPFEVGVGEEVNLRDLLTVQPKGAAMPQNGWALEGISNGEATLSGDVLKGVKPIADAMVYFVSPSTSLEQANIAILARAQFSVVQRATGINIVTATFQVNKNDKNTLTGFMQNKNNKLAYSLEPSDATGSPEWEIEDDTYITTMDGWTPVKVGETHIRPYLMAADGSKIYPADNKWITIKIVSPVTKAYLSWEADAVNVKCNVGDDIYSRIATCIKIEPSDAVQTYTISVPDEENAQYFTIGNNSIKVDKAPESTNPINLLVTPTGVNGGQFAFRVPVSIDNWATTLEKVEDALAFTATTAPATIQQAIANNVTYGPKGTGPNITFTSPGPWLALTLSTTSEGGRGDLKLEDGDLQLSMEPGEHTVTATLTYPDYSNYYGKASDITNKTKTVTFTVSITAVLKNFTITITPDSSDPTTGTITLNPSPADAVYDIKDYSFSITESSGDYSQNKWNFITVSPALTTKQLTYTYSNALPGTYTFSATKGDNSFGSKQFSVPVKVEFANGWQWKGNAYGTVNRDELNSFFTTNLVEARTYTDLLYNDASWGFVGSMMSKALPNGQMYKVNMKAAATSFVNGVKGEQPAIANATRWVLAPGWNWVASPYLYDHLFSNALVSSGAVKNMVIVSKADGSIEYNDKWEGSLKLLKAGQGYLVYNPSTEDVTLTNNAETSLGQGNESASARNRAPMTSVWEYDHSRFANNMTMVAEMPQLENADDYTIGAFVDDECRGEGYFENGHAFITVHCNSGEQVTFRLYNEMTGEYFDIDQTVKSQTRVGSLTNPFRMTSEVVSTGIRTIVQDEQTTGRYDLSGRKVAGNSKGVSLQRMADGTFRKVMK